MKKAVIFIACLSIALPVWAKEHNGKKMKTLPPGLEKKLERTGELPPGWQKKLVKGEILDPGLYELSRKISDPQQGDVQHPDAGTEVIKIEDRIIRIKKDSREILDILGVENDL